MSKKLMLVVAVLLLLSGTAFSATKNDLLKGWVHPGNEAIKESGYQGAQTCAMCHPNALEEITQTAHWYMATPIRNVQGLPEGTWWGMLNRECSLAGSLTVSNWTASTNGHATVQAAGCGMCHIGALTMPPLPAGQPPTQAQTNTVDCLVCHAKDYNWKDRETLVTDATGTHWGQDKSLKAALSITKVPTNEACLRCHEHSFSYDYKRGTPYTPQNDVHAKAGLDCVTCHVTEHHKMAKGQYESDMVANDLPDVKVTCSNCHGDAPHRGKTGKILNEHIAKLSCQTCHIPTVSGIVWENWGEPVKDDIHGKYSELSRYDKIPSIKGICVPKVKIEKGYPSYIWRIPNTKDNQDAQSWMAFTTATINIPGAKIYPVRALTQILLFDKKYKMWQEPGMGFLKDNPQMANFPALLAPNREVYNKTCNVKEAIDAGMKPFEAMGFTWSGEWMAMQVPQLSYISVNHGVKKIGLSCNKCHSPHGVMNFKELGYTPAQIKELEKPQYK